MYFKGYYRKGMALMGLHRQEAAMVAFLQSLTLDPFATSARKYLAKVIKKGTYHFGDVEPRYTLGSIFQWVDWPFKTKQMSVRPVIFVGFSWFQDFYKSPFA